MCDFVGDFGVSMKNEKSELRQRFTIEVKSIQMYLVWLNALPQICTVRPLTVDASVKKK